MTQMFTHCGYCGSRFYLAGPCNHIHRVLDWPTCDSCDDRFRVFPRLPEVLQEMRGFRKQWIEDHADWIGELGRKYGHVLDGVTGHNVKDLVLRLADGFDVDIRLEEELNRRMYKDRDTEIYRQLRKGYRGISLVLDGIKVVVRDLNYESVDMVSAVMSYWDGSEDWRRWLDNNVAGKYFVVRQSHKVIGYISKRHNSWASTPNLDAIWWSWTKRDSREGAVKVLLASAGLISREGNEESESAIIRRAMKG